MLAAILAVVFLFIPNIEQNDVFLRAVDIWAVMGLCILVAIISIVAIFLFKNRSSQIKIGRLNIVLILILMGVAVYFELQDGDFQPYFGIGLPLIVLILNVLAIQAVQADDKLIRSADRLR